MALAAARALGIATLITDHHLAGRELPAADVIVNPNDAPMEHAKLFDQVADKSGLLCMITDRVNEQLLAAAPNLKMVANCGVGYDNIDVAAATSRTLLNWLRPNIHERASLSDRMDVIR